VAVDQHRHFAHAADHCHVTQATLSAMIKKLEGELGLVLFDRSRKPVITTEQGLQVVLLAKEILQRKEIMSELSAKPDILSGNIRLGIIPTIANSLLPIILPSLLRDHPELHLNITEITTDEIIQQIETGKIDMGILATPLDKTNLEENILYYEAMMIYGVKPDTKKYVPPKTIANQKIWLLEEGNCFRNQSITICNIREKVIEPENLSFEGSSFDTLLNLTDQFGGYTLVPELYYNLMPKEKKQKTRHFELPMPVREISLVYQRPFAKRKSIDILAGQIKSKIAGRLVTAKHAPKDLSIIGI
jgi:LysR family hydrogen peroxide-inducible transcriptional activator